MARTLSLSFSKAYLTTATTTRSSSASSRIFFCRYQSNLASPNPNQTDHADESSSSTDPLLRKLEDAIHRIIVRRAAPDWLPFLPGSSYWVPPPRSSSTGIAQLVEKLANPLTDEENLSTTTVRGWPSSDYFIKDAPPSMTDVKVEFIKVEEERPSSSPNIVSKSEDEEG